MSDLISRQAAIREYQELCKGMKCGECPLLIKVNTEKGSHLITDCKLEAFLRDLPSVDVPEHISNREWKGQTMSNDLIRRSDVIKFLNDYLDDCYRVSRRKYEKTMLDAISMDFEAVITDIPAVEPKQGEWNPYYTEREHNNIFNCELCGNTFFVMQGKDDMNFCPNCGSLMKGGAE